MEIRILRVVSLDFEGKQKVYSPSNKTISISDELAKEKNYVERYQKYPKHIEILKLPDADNETLKEELKAEIKAELQQEKDSAIESAVEEEVKEKKPSKVAKKETKPKE